MPELPEVEGFRFIAENAKGQEIKAVEILDPYMVKLSDPKWFETLVGYKVGTIARRGKILCVYSDGTTADSPVVVMRFGMTGRLVFGPYAPNPYDRLLITTSKGVLAYRNARRLGSIEIIVRSDVAEFLWQLGPEAPSLDSRWFTEAITLRDVAIKALILDQKFIAGLGNIYADEALYSARIAPQRRAYSLTTGEAKKLASAIRRVMRVALADPDIDKTPNLPLFKLRREASSRRRGDGLVPIGCPRCRIALRTDTVGGRTSYWCDHCQS